MESAAENQSGVASAGVGMGAGMGMGFMLPQMLSGAMQSGQEGQGKQSASPMDKLKKLKELLDMGALSQEEYDKKKEKLLEEI
jgi:membrane protease subunit (stomatin/prohibitin family)